MKGDNEGIEANNELANRTGFQVNSCCSNTQPRDSLSLTGSRDLHNYVEVLARRLTQPIFLHGLPFSQRFAVLKFEVTKRMLIVSFEINVDLLEFGSKSCHFTS
jgi:hypothetical protein